MKWGECNDNEDIEWWLSGEYCEINEDDDELKPDGGDISGDHHCDDCDDGLYDCGEENIDEFI